MQLNVNRFKATILFLCLLACLLFIGGVRAADIGSDTAVSRVKSHQSISDGDRIAGFVALENGFVAASDTGINFTYDSYFPISGELDFKNSNMYLARDLGITSTYFSLLSSGAIFGQGNSIIFGPSVNDLTFPLELSNGSFNLVDSAATGGIIYSLDWTDTGDYIAVSPFAKNELKIYYVDSGLLTLTHEVSVVPSTVVINSVDYNPAEYYIAVGREAAVNANNLFIYYHNIANGTLTVTQSYNTASVKSVAWDSLGDVLITASTNKINAFDFVPNGATAGTLTWTEEYSFATGTTFSSDTISWANNYPYFAVGSNSPSGDSDLSVFYYKEGDSSSVLTVTESLALTDVSITSLDWSPTGSYIAVGLSDNGDSETLRVYKFTHSDTFADFQEVATARVGENSTVYSVA